MSIKECVAATRPTRSKQSHVLAAYQQRLEKTEAEFAHTQKQRFRAYVGLFACAIASAVCAGFAALLGSSLLLQVSILPGFALLPVWSVYKRRGREWRRLAARQESLQGGIARLTHTWQTTEHTGLEFARANHLYQTDLDVLGEGSLFALLCTTGTRLGSERLAEFLLDSPDLDAMRARQNCVRELQDANGLFENVDALESARGQGCTAAEIAAWLDAPSIPVPRFVPALLGILSASAIVLGVGMWAQALAWQVWPVLLALPLLQLGTVFTLRPRTGDKMEHLRGIDGAFTAVQQGIALLEGLSFKSSDLQRMVKRLRADRASMQLQKLDRLLRAFDQREKPEFYVASRALAAGTQLLLAVERWRALHADSLRVWLDLWAEFEALLAVARFAYEHPDYTYPELVDGPATLTVGNLGHPLLPDGACVLNNVELRQASRFYLITGSNMAGKSTLLRAIGLNAVLAQAGAPVRATRALISRLQLCAAFVPRESLQEGRSKFLAEVGRLRGAVAAVQAGASVLFLIDEILSGTNAQDRRIAAESIVRELLKTNAIGAVSTHDPALASPAQAVGGRLMHMESPDPNDPLAFDFLLKPGLSQNSSALAIVRMMGIAS